LALSSIRRDFCATRKLAEDATRDLGIGVIKGIEVGAHERFLSAA
jgi:hypothetical protein